MTREEILQYIKSELANENTEIYLDVDDYKIIVKALEQELTTKSDLEVDAVSRQAVLELIADYDLSMGQVVRGIHALPSVTPQPRKGHWIDADGDNAICGCCNRLNHLYGAYCKHCGAKMVVPQESDENLCGK